MVRTFKNNLIPLANMLSEAMHARNPHIISVTVQNNKDGYYCVYTTIQNDLKVDKTDNVTLFAGSMDATHAYLTGACWAV